MRLIRKFLNLLKLTAAFEFGHKHAKYVLGHEKLHHLVAGIAGTTVIVIAIAVGCGQKNPITRYPAGSDNLLDWIFVDNGAVNSQGDASQPNAIVFNSKIYQARQEYLNNAAHIRVSVYNGDDLHPNWTSVDLGQNGLNIDPTRNAYSPQLVIFNSSLYIFWAEQTATTNVLHGKVYNGNDKSPQWTTVDGSGNHILSVLFGPTPFVYNSKLYLIGRENTAVRVMVYNSNDSLPSWSYVDSGGLNYNLSDFTGNSYPQLVSVNNKLYAFWTESLQPCCVDQLRIKVYNGNDTAPQWTFVDGGTSTGINRDVTHLALRPIPINYHSKLYVMWSESTANLSAPSYQIRVSVYNGNDGTPVWTALDKGGSSGLNYNNTARAITGNFVITPNDKLYATWSESGAIRVAQYGGNDSSPVWTFIDGGTATGLVKNAVEGTGLSNLLSNNSGLYAMWAETVKSTGKIRVAVKKMNFIIAQAVDLQGNPFPFINFKMTNYIPSERYEGTDYATDKDGYFAIENATPGTTLYVTRASTAAPDLDHGFLISSGTDRFDISRFAPEGHATLVPDGSAAVQKLVLRRVLYSNGLQSGENPQEGQEQNANNPLTSIAQAFKPTTNMSICGVGMAIYPPGGTISITTDNAGKPGTVLTAGVAQDAAQISWETFYNTSGHWMLNRNMMFDTCKASNAKLNLVSGQTYWVVYRYPYLQNWVSSVRAGTVAPPDRYVPMKSPDGVSWVPAVFDTSSCTSCSQINALSIYLTE